VSEVKSKSRLLCRGYAKALRLLTRGPTTWKTIQARLECTRMTAQRLAHGFHDKGLSHITRWTPVASGSTLLIPVYRFGPGEDVPHPQGKVLRPRRRQMGIELRTFCNAVHALREDRHLGKTLGDVTGMNPTAARLCIRALRDEHLIYVAEYQERVNRGTGYPLYAWGPMHPDLPKPPPQPLQVLWAKNNAMRGARQRQQNLLLAMQGKGDPRRRMPDFSAANAEELSQRA